MKPDSKLLPFQVEDFSSEDPQHPAQNLLSVKKENRGWQSLQGSQFPQHVLLDL